MGYPTTVDTGQIVPMALYDGEVASQATAAVLAANTAYLIAVTLSVNAVLTNIRVRCNAGGNGHYDVGIYDATGTNGQAGNLLAHAAATASSLVTSSALLTPALIGGNLPLAPGRYWLALWVDNATDTWNKIASPNANTFPVQSGTNNGPLPALASSLSSLANATIKPTIIGLLSGGWS
jgi:hypothetical protein